MPVPVRLLAATVAGALAGATALAGAVPAQAAARPPVPLTVANSSGSPERMFVTVVGHLVDAGAVPGPEGYLAADGSFVPFPSGGTGAPTPAPDVSMDGPTTGSAAEVPVPFGFSGRMYYSFGEPVGFRLVSGADGRTGLVQPVPWAPESPDSEVDVDFDFVELSYTSWGLYLNSTQVDGMVIPASVAVTSTDGEITRTGVTTEAVSAIAQRLAGVPGFAASVQTDGGVLRLVNPTKLVESGRMDADYLDTYVDNVWDAYAGGASLRVQPWKDRPTDVFTGTVVDGRFVFRDTAGAVVASFDRPTTADVWRCDGALSSPNDAAVGPIARSLCADLNRGVLGSQPVSPATDPDTYYRTNPVNEGLFNHYSAAVHAAMQDGAAYGFAFDDVAGQESLVHSPTPRAASVDVLPRATGGRGITGPAVRGEETASAAGPSGSSRTLQVSLGADSPGYAHLTLGPGTTAGLVSITVDGARPTVASVGGPGTSRVDLVASAGERMVTVTSTGMLGSVALHVPGTAGAAVPPATGPVPTAPTPTPPSARVRVLPVTLATASPGYAHLTFGAGTAPGLVAVSVDSGAPRTASVTGPGTIRVDLAAGPGSHIVTVSSTGDLGEVSIQVPGTDQLPGSPAVPPVPAPPAAPGVQRLTLTLSAPSPGYGWITLPSGTAPGIVTVTVAGVSSTIAVSGPTTTRVNMAAGPGTHEVTVTSTGALGAGVTLAVG